ncbi:MAG: T9SS type A sorting domain-containing protein [Melioribacteraceae bacterium]|nr:T9SS type A sorting domain-containing protein [Melioribacteraceae bacterium]
MNIPTTVIVAEAVSKLPKVVIQRSEVTKEYVFLVKKTRFLTLFGMTNHTFETASRTLTQKINRLLYCYQSEVKMRLFYLIITIMFFTSISEAQNIFFSKDTLIYLEYQYPYWDSLYIKGDSNENQSLLIDSIVNNSSMNGYLIEYYHSDSLIKSCDLYCYEGCSNAEFFPLKIPVNDSVKIKMELILPVTKINLFESMKTDSLIFHTNSKNMPIFKLNILNDIPVKVNNEETEINYSLSQNYPNPFNPSTNIKYSIESANHVQIKVFDIIGREIITLVDDFKLTGNYNIDFNTNELPSGIYLYRIFSGNYNKTKKMLLLK